MTDPGLRWTAEQVLALAPDDASRRAGGRLGTAGPWLGTGRTAAGVLWGSCEGSGTVPYRTAVDSAGPAYRCTCPSRKSPCKHALGLLLLHTADASAVPVRAEPPDWAARWPPSRAEGRDGPEGAAGSPAAPAERGGQDAARRRAERRAARITAGVMELEQRLADLLRGGLAAAEQQGRGLWEETAARMVDAQAPGLAARARELGAIPGSGPGWPGRLLEEAALLHLLDRAWLGRSALPVPLATTVRTRIGLPAVVARDEVRDVWSVLAQYDTSDGKLTTRRAWLYGRDTGRWAVVVTYGAAGRAPEPAPPAGSAVDAALRPHEGSGALRAGWGEQFAAPVPLPGPPPGGSVAAAVDAYGTALREDPWLEHWPVTLRAVVPVRAVAGDGPSASGAPEADAGWQLADADGGAALPVAPAALRTAGLWKLVALAGGRPVTVFGECGHRGVRPLAAWSPEAPDLVPLV